MIKDSGERREFESGAVRDITEGKGSCDLLPLGVVSRLLLFEQHQKVPSYVGSFLHDIYMFTKTKNVEHLYRLLMGASLLMFETLETAILELSVHFEEGMKKYGIDNWKKGIPEFSYIDSSIRHLLKWSRGDDDERHDRAFLWNITCLIWTIENIKVEE